MKILITSVSSFVGRYIARKLLLDGYAVTGTYRTYSSIIKNLEQKYAMKSLQNKFSISSEIKDLNESFDVFINCSGAFPNGKFSLEDIVSLNVKNAYFIGENIVKQKNLPRMVINFSTLSIYGDLKTAIIDDRTKPAPSNIYGSSKLLCENILSEFLQNEMPLINIRLPAILGEGAHTAWLPSLVKKMQKNQEIKIFNPKSYYNACTTLNTLYKFTNTLIKTDLKNDTFTFPVGAKGDMTIIQIIDFIKNYLNSLSAISINKNNFPCCKVESKQAECLGYTSPTTSYSIEYLLRKIV